MRSIRKAALGAAVVTVGIAALVIWRPAPAEPRPDATVAASASPTVTATDADAVAAKKADLRAQRATTAPNRQFDLSDFDAPGIYPREAPAAAADFLDSNYLSQNVDGVHYAVYAAPTAAATPRPARSASPRSAPTIRTAGLCSSPSPVWVRSP